MPTLCLVPACRLIRRCGSRSLAYWSAQQAGGAPTAESKRQLYGGAVQVR